MTLALWGALALVLGVAAVLWAAVRVGARHAVTEARLEQAGAKAETRERMDETDTAFMPDTAREFLRTRRQRQRDL